MPKNRTPPAPDPVATARYQRLTWRLLLALILWLALAKLLVAPAALSTQAVLVGSLLGWLLHSLPLWLFVPGIRRGKARSAVWLGYVLLVYFVYAAVRFGVASVSGWVALIEGALIAGLFVAAMRFVRLQRALQNGEL